MGIPNENVNEYENLPAALRKLVEDELKGGSEVIEFGHGFPAAPCGAYIKLASQVETRHRAASGELSFYDRDSNNYSGEFTDANRHFFVQEPPHPPKPAPDMQAMLAAINVKYSANAALQLQVTNRSTASDDRVDILEKDKRGEGHGASKDTFMIRLLSVLFLIVVTFAKVAVAGVEFRESTITSELEKVPAGTTVTVNVVIKNTGDKSAEGTDVRIRLPLAGFLVRIDELPELKRDNEERQISARVDIPAGEEFRFSFDLLASRTEVGGYLVSHIEVVYLWDQIRWNAEFSKRITSVPSTAGVVIGGLRIHPAAGWLLGWMVCFALMFVWVRVRLRRLAPANARRTSAFGIVALVMFPLAFLLVLGGMAWRDLQTLTSWKESQASILDRREDVEVSKTEWHKDGRRKPSSVTRTPEFALKYQAGDREVISSGFVTGPSVHVGTQILGKSEYDQWIIGKTIPCWYDPSDPGFVVVQRGFGIKYLFFGLFFGLVPLVILGFGFGQLRKVSAGM